ncbi:hypothetical protein HYH03_003844 [Edaphochlamys debaryana]|uniref:K Homology domain-containing protein n=1 Tax=Edaphochlamys debaryana TaxID=47281 RepID=A0A836C2J7_9CHLO|nr:hypothetical protein HYH03_003844 [Edaphochlamys debaryana]|eukprot:KAG2498086.1 hypothetical protein HYH03_003844 [Edaphochlamys debaryana]
MAQPAAAARAVVELGCMPPGLVIGRGGGNVKALSERVGGGLRISVREGQAVLTGPSPAAVEAAASLLRAQVEAHARGVAGPNRQQLPSPAAAEPAAARAPVEVPAARAVVELGCMPPGLVIGKGGCNVKALSERAGGGVRVQVLEGEGRAVLTGRSREAVEAAAALLREQFEANALGATQAYPHPLRMDYVLTEAGFGPEPCGVVHFQPRDRATDETARHVARPQQLYVPAPGHPDVGGGGEPLMPATPKALTAGPGGGAGAAGSRTAADGLAEALGAVSLGAVEGPALPPPRPSASSAVQPRRTSTGTIVNGGFHGSAAAGPGGAVSAALTSAARKAAAHRPAFSALKLRFNLGKQYFFSVPLALRQTSLEQLQAVARSKGRLPQGVFSNAVPGAQVGPMQRALLGPRLGFVLTDRKDVATVHVVDQRINRHYAISLTFVEGRAVLSKLKADSCRLHTAALLQGPGRLDARLKLMGVLGGQQAGAEAGQAPGGQALAAAVLAAASGPERFAPFEDRSAEGVLRVLRLLPPHTELQSVRRKAKAVYEGRLEVGCGQPPVRVKVAVKQVEDSASRRWEASGTLPDMDPDLGELREAARGGGGAGGGGGGAGGSDWAARALQAVGAFVQAVSAALEAEAS